MDSSIWTWISIQYPLILLQFPFNCLSHPSLYEVKFPHPKEWTFEEGEWVTVSSSEKEATVAAVKATHLEVELATDEGIELV